MLVSEKIREFAQEHGIVPSDDYPSYLAREINRIEGVEGDETLDLIIEMARRNILSEDEALEFVLRHSDEIDALRIEEGSYGRKAVGSL
jgi:hypothetical protein